jgi:integrase
MAKKRGNNEGTITRRKDGLWEARISLGRDPVTGKSKRVSFYGRASAFRLSC